MKFLKKYAFLALKGLEKYTKTDMVYLAKGGFWMNLNFFISSLLAFILSVALAHFLPKETYGVYQYLLSLSAIFTAFSLTGMNSAITQSVARGYEGSFIASIGPQLKWGLLSSAGAIIMSVYYTHNGAYPLAISLIIIAILLPIVNATNTYTAFFTGRRDFKKTFLYNNVFNLIYTITTIITIIYTKNPVLLILVYFIVNSLINTLLFIRSVKENRPNTYIDSDTLPYAKHLSGMNVIGTIANRLDSVLVFHYLGAANLALYTFARLLPEKIGGAIKSIGSIAFPRFSVRETSDVRSTILHKTTLFIIASIICSLIYILISPLLFKFFFPKYIDAILYSQLFSLSLFSAAASLPTYALMSQKLKKELYILNTISPIAQLIILFTMLYLWGIWGLIYSKIVSGAIHVFVSTFLAHTRTGVARL